MSSAEPIKVKKSETSRVMRVSGENYAAFTKTHKALAKRLGLKRCTYDAVLSEVLGLMDALLRGDELYVVGEQAFADLAEARGQAVLEAVRKQEPVQLPVVCLRIGKDPGPGV